MSELADLYYNIKLQAGCEDPDKINEMLSCMTNKDIMKADGLDQYSKFYLVSLKYGKNIIDEAVLKECKLVFKGAALNLNNPHFVKITSLGYAERGVVIRGFICSLVLGIRFSLFVKDDNGNTYEPELERYPQKDVSGLNGEVISQGSLFKFNLPEGDYRFFMSIHGGTSDGAVIQLDPSFEESTGLTRDVSFSCADSCSRMVSYSESRLKIEKVDATLFCRAIEKFREAVDAAEKDSVRQKWQTDLKIRELVREAELKNRICFITTRSDGKLLGNMQRVYDAVKGDKVFFAKTHLKQDADATLQAALMMYSSKVVVTDDYLFLLRNYGKAKGQKVVQLWHATGSFKKFGQDGTSFFPDVDARYHKDYDLVTVSSELVREVYAGAFDIPVEKTVAKGVARTDEFFDVSHQKQIISEIQDAHPELTGKKVIVYAPTFRTLQGRDRSIFRPDIDFDELSEALGESQIMVICPHPVMTEPILSREYDNIIEVRDFSTNDMMYAANLLITDYSSVIFEFSLLDKPMLFYCYDFDEYDRDFYLDYEHDLPGDIVKSKGELCRIIKAGEYEADSRMRAFREKYMGACDGRSTERIAGMIDKMAETE